MEGETALSKVVVFKEVVQEANNSISPLTHIHALVYEVVDLL